MIETSRLFAPRYLLIVCGALAALASYSPYLSGTVAPPFVGMFSFLVAPGMLAAIAGQNYANVHGQEAVAVLNAVVAAVTGAILLACLPDRWSAAARRAAVLGWASCLPC